MPTRREFGGVFGTFASVGTMGEGVRAIQGDPSVNRARHGFFELEREVREINREQGDVPDLDLPR